MSGMKKKAYTTDRSGFTLLEVAFSIAILATLCAFVLVGFLGFLRVGSMQQYLQNLDMQGSRIMQEATFLLRPAILPIKVDGSSSSDKAAAFKLLDSSAHGFGGSEGAAWRSKLRAGVDSLAYVVPVDAQGDDDILDDDSRLETGQMRRDGTVSLDSTFTSTGAGFLLDTTGVASSLVRVSPDKLANDNTGGSLDVSGWPAALYGAGTAPDTSAFTVIRYVPKRVTGTNTLVTIKESDLQIDLDGDGLFTSEFNIGRLQIVYVGGMHAVQVNPTGLPVMQNMDTQVIDLSGDYILRNVSAADHQPIFKLVRYSAANVATNGIVDLDGGKGSLALVLRVNLFDVDGYESMRPRLSYDQKDQLNRVYEATIMLRNMAR